jgi:YHS domain-containing protein
MTDVNSLASRLDAEFSAVEQKIKQQQAQQVQDYKGRQQRLELLGKVFEEMRDVWKPRLDLLVKKFGDKVQVKPRVAPSAREATFDFQSRAARVRLKFSAFTDRDVQKLILAYNLEIIPILMRFTQHAEAEYPLSAVDKAAAGKWIDDRIVDFVKTYFSMGENEVYFKDEMVEDPVAHVSFPRFAAAASLEWQGKKYYFIGEETRHEFAEKNKIPIG